MAAVIPTQYFSGYAVANGNIQIPIASLNGLTAAQADAATGDARAVLIHLIETAYRANLALASSARPTRITLAKGNPTLPSSSTLQDSYTVVATKGLDPSSLALAPE